MILILHLLDRSFSALCVRVNVIATIALRSPLITVFAIQVRAFYQSENKMGYDNVLQVDESQKFPG